MKKFLLIVMAACMTAALFAQESEPQSTLYGYFRLDFDYTKAMSEDDTFNALDGFNVARSRLGWEYRMSEVLKSVLEVELFEKQTFTDNDTGGTDTTETLRTINIRLAYISWEVIENLTLSAGKMYQVFTPESLDLYDKKTDCIEAAYDFDIGTFALQVGGNDDVDKQSLLIMPGLIITPDLGDISLKAGVNAQFVTPYASDDDMGIGANVYVIFGIADLEVILDADALDLHDEAAGIINAYATLKYTIDILKPVVNAYLYDLAANTGDVEMNIDFGAEIEAVKGFVIYPFLTLKNLSEANGAEMDWEFTLRFQWKPKYKF
ncbi:MAG: hypothetical protein JW822_09765 [Spirochaetales bacterium]|nr:hypothetical protein [Spirochaetales bacterium]